MLYFLISCLLSAFLTNSKLSESKNHILLFAYVPLMMPVSKILRVKKYIYEQY